jgi:hypothetical protein
MKILLVSILLNLTVLVVSGHYLGLSNSPLLTMVFYLSVVLFHVLGFIAGIVFVLTASGSFASILSKRSRDDCK